MGEPAPIALSDVRRGRHVRILSIDPGARRPGFACIECWWDDDDTNTWPRIKPLLLMGDPVISSEVRSVKKFGRIKCINALDDFFQAHGEELFKHKPDFAVVETQKGQNNRLIDSLSMVMYATCRHAHKLFPDTCHAAMKTSMCPATWKTQGLGVAPGPSFYHARKAACVAKARELLCANGYHRTAANVAKDEAKNDISDALMQAVQFFMHTFPKVPKGKARGKGKGKGKRQARGTPTAAPVPRASKRARRGTHETNDSATIDLTADSSGKESTDDDDGEGEASMIVSLDGGMTMRCGALAAVERLQRAVQAHCGSAQE